MITYFFQPLVCYWLITSFVCLFDWLIQNLCNKHIYVIRYVICNRWLWRFEFQLSHSILSPALATDKKWPLSQFHISCQNSEISWPKVQISDFQSQFSMLKNIPNFLKRFFISGTHFLLLTFFEKYNIYSTLLILKLGPFFVSWFLRFGKRYATDLSVAKVVHRKLIFKS